MKSPKSPILVELEKAISQWFIGMATPDIVEVNDDRVIDGVDYVYGVSDRKRRVVVEKLHKFNRTALRNMRKRKIKKADPRYGGGEDTMIVKVGKPGSRERVEALRSQYEAVAAAGEEVSPFAWEG